MRDADLMVILIVGQEVEPIALVVTLYQLYELVFKVQEVNLHTILFIRFLFALLDGELNVLLLINEND